MTTVFQYTLENLGEKPFHLFGRLNYAAMDSTLVAAGEALKNNVTGLHARYVTLIEEKDYIEWVTKDTSDEKILTSRIKKALSILAG
jgi:hypothetical protein